MDHLLSNEKEKNVKRLSLRSRFYLVLKDREILLRDRSLKTE